MSYNNALTPPSSNEGDSPIPIYFVASPTSSTFQNPDSAAASPAFNAPYSANENTMGPKGAEPFLKFLEKPNDRFRFRYKSEMAGTHGSLNGQYSDKSRKQTFPTVELMNYNKPAMIRCSIYQMTSGTEPKPHAHRLIKKQGKDELDDPHSVPVSPDEGYVASFHSMGIIHTAKKNVVYELVKKKSQLKKEEIARLEGQIRELNLREEVEIKRMAEAESKAINLNIVCLRFDALIENAGILYPICPPLFSSGINNLKSALTGELKIVRMDKCTSPSKGNREIFLLVERVTKKNIKVRFYELDENDDVVWEDYGKFTDLDVHHQYAIVFRTPKYRDIYITKKVNVFIELVRPSDQAHSEPKEFVFTPCDYNEPGSKRSRSETDYSSGSGSFGSNILPLTIGELLAANCDRVTSLDLNEAVGNIDSDEFNEVFMNYKHLLEASPIDVLPIDPPMDMSDALIAEPPVSIAFDGVDPADAPPELDSDLKFANYVYEQLENFQRTNPNQRRCVNFLKKYFGLDTTRNNPLHTYIIANATQNSLYILKWISLYKQHHLVNNVNLNNETPLHLAVKSDNETIVRNLLNCQADVTPMNMDCNTPLHLAVIHNSRIEILEMLLKREEVKSCIDVTNRDGDTALILAIKENNMKAIKLLSMHGADVNLKHQANGYSALRFALQSEKPEIIKYILGNKKLRPLEVDFSDINVFEAACRTSTCPQNVMEIIKNYMMENDIKVGIKQESLSDEICIKDEPVSIQDLYANVTTFTPECLNEVAAILDLSGSWEYLAESLELVHYIRSGIISSSGSISKNIIEYAVSHNNDTIFQIRTLLDDLDEKRVVQLIDAMVRKQS